MIGKTVSHYRILEELGRGGMGVVYKAEDTKLKRTVALKFLPPELTRDPEAKQRFIQEAQAASALQHNNIATIHEINETKPAPGEPGDGQMFICMDCYEGETLKDKIRRAPLEIDEAIHIATQIAQGLTKAHEQNIIHRDIKPANILVTNDGIVKILDFGLAKLAGQAQLTKDSSTLGTVAYMSPEQARGESVDQRTDIWALGVVLYEMLTGQLPFKGDYEQAAIYAILNETPDPPTKLQPNIPKALEDVILKALAKNTQQRYNSTKDMISDMQRLQAVPHEGRSKSSLGKSLLHFLMNPAVASAFFFLLVILVAATWFFNRQAKIKWARLEAIPEIRRIINEARYFGGLSAALEIAEEAEKYLPDDPELSELLNKCAVTTTINSEPTGAHIYKKIYQNPDHKWEYLGKTPLDSIWLAKDYFRWKIEKTGFRTIYPVTTKYQLGDLTEFVLDKTDSIAMDMVQIRQQDSEIGQLPDFLYDKFEVTNQEYKEFIHAGGYHNPEYWRFPFIRNGREISWQQAMKYFVDQTGRPGPETWYAGDYPDGEDDFPVSGVSWYEAAAYAAYRQKSLPTIYHWSAANGIIYPLPQLPSFLVVPLSNFSQKGPQQVGSNSGISVSGAYDFAGNVREWCYNASVGGRCLRGGSWSDPPYMAYRITQASPFDRAPQNGFRCVQYINVDSIPKQAFQIYATSRENDDYRFVQPVSDDIYQAYKKAFDYDKEELDMRLEYRDKSGRDWIKEKISYNAAYNNERISAYLYLPRHVQEPFQTIIIYPHAGATRGNSSENLEDTEGFDFFIKDGRAVFYPIYKGTYERGGLYYWVLIGQVSTRKYFDLVTQLVRDFRHSVDYLAKRDDIDMEKLAYYSYSWGGEIYSIIAAVEERLKLGILNTGGMRGFDAGGKIFPLADPINYVSRVKIPTLMLNGEYDMIYQYDKVVKPMYDLLGTADNDKRLITYPTDHFVPRNELIKESLKWLDQYFGPVER